jgi:hypothetical protein
MSVDISVSITEDIVDIIATPTVNIVNVTNSASIDPGLYDLSEFTNTSPNPFVRTSGLSSYVPTSRTLTINGTTQDLSADRTFTISTGITIGTTAITSGTVGRVLFEGTGNVVQESANLFWDNTNGRLGIGTSSPSNSLTIKTGVNDDGILLESSVGNPLFLVRKDGTSNSTAELFQYSNGSIRLAIRSASNFSYFNGGNFGFGTTTDAGFRLDVNGNSRVRGAGATGSTNAFTVQNSSGSSALSITNGLTTIVHGDLQLENTVLYWSSGSQIRNISNGVLRISDSTNANFTRLQFGGGTTSYPSLQRSGSALAIMDATGTALTNLLVGTTTDAGFRLDVNGTARVTSSLRVESSFSALSSATIGGTTLAANAILQVNGSGKYVNYNSSFSSGSFLTYQAFGTWEAIGADSPAGTILAFGGYRASQWTGITFHSNGSERMRIKSTGVINMSSVPTSSAGLSAGDIWNDAGTLKIV